MRNELDKLVNSLAEHSAKLYEKNYAPFKTKASRENFLKEQRKKARQRLERKYKKKSIEGVKDVEEISQ